MKTRSQKSAILFPERRRSWKRIPKKGMPLYSYMERRRLTEAAKLLVYGAAYAALSAAVRKWMK